VKELPSPILTYNFPALTAHAHGSFVSVVGVTDDGSVVFVCARPEGRAWELPGGAIEEDESVDAAAVREFYEETGWHLESPVAAAEIHNRCLDGSPHSRVVLVAGRVSPDESPYESAEVSQREIRSTVPVDTTFDHGWMSRLVEIGKESLRREVNRQMWDAAAPSYDHATHISEEEVHFGPLIHGESRLQLLPCCKGARVLDLGCGAGHNLAAIFRRGAADGLGVDFCQEQLRRARARLQHYPCELIQEDIANLPFGERGPFDLIISVFSLSFVARIEQVLVEVARGLRPGGTLIISTDHPLRVGQWEGDGFSIGDWFGGRNRSRLWEIPGQPPSPYEHHLHSLPTLIGAISDAGLIIERVLEPRAVPLEKLEESPYRSDYFIARHEELSHIPYSIIIKARAPREW
jgi:SAM-dependent methyltransferase